jgi:hypothetical protein
MTEANDPLDEPDQLAGRSGASKDGADGRDRYRGYRTLGWETVTGTGDDPVAAGSRGRASVCREDG